MRTHVGFCPICATALYSFETEAHRIKFDCRHGQCGTFYASSTLLAQLGWRQEALERKLPLRKQAVVGFFLRQQQIVGRTPILDCDRWEKLVDGDWLPSPPEQVDNLITLIGGRGEVGTRVAIRSDQDQFIVGTPSTDGVGFLIQSLHSSGLLSDHRQASQIESHVRLSLKGWELFEALRRGKATVRTAFMAMPFNIIDLDTTIWATGKTAAQICGYRLERLDENPEPGNIDTRMRVAIKKARFLIVDLTHSNNGAYWEAGFAEGLGKPVIYTVREDHNKTVHFDTDHSQRVIWRSDNLAAAERNIISMIRNGLPDAHHDDD